MSTIELHEIKSELCRNIESITLEMRNRLESGEIEKFYTLVDARQSLMDKVNEINAEMIVSENIREEEMISVENIINETLDVLKNVVQSNGIVNNKLQDNYNVIKAKLRKITESKVAMKTYAKKPSQHTGFFVEKKK